MRLLAVLFGLLLISGLSFGGNSFFGSVPSIAQDDPSGEAPGGKIKDEATNGSGAETGNMEKAHDQGEMPAGEIKDEATNGSGAETGNMEKAHDQGEMPAGEMKDNAPE